MSSPYKRGAGLVRKAAVASAVLGGLLLFLGAGTASARPICYPQPRARVVIVHPGFYRPHVVYYTRVVPAYRVYPQPYARRYRDARFHCWRYYR